MDRIVKFRGLRVDGKKWVYGDLKRSKDNRRGGTWWYIWVDSDDIEEDGEYVQVLPHTVGQFTGLFDKNGKEIYEGDRVKHGNNIFIVRHSINRHVLVLKKENDTGMNWRDLEWLGRVKKYVEVVDSIHERKL